MFLLPWLESEAKSPFPLPRWQGKFVLKHGRPFTPRPLPKGIKPSELHLCFENNQMALPGSDLVYCEGYALQKGLTRPTHHAWLSTRDGFVVDRTWTAKRLNLKKAAIPLGVEYFGVPFNMIFVLHHSFHVGSYCSLLDASDEWSLWKSKPPTKKFLEQIG